MIDKQFTVSGKWALASDGIQWILQQQRLTYGKVTWRNLSFVRSSKAILARCMRDKGVEPADAERLLSDLPNTFDEWLAGGGGSRMSHPGSRIPANR